jgi:hypothetical protein
MPASPELRPGEALAWIPKEAKLTNNLASRRSELSEDSRLALFDLVIAWRE